MEQTVQDFVDFLFSDKSEVVHFVDKYGRRSESKTAVRCVFDQYVVGCWISYKTNNDEIRYVADQLCDSLPFETAPTCAADRFQRSCVRKKMRKLRDSFQENK
jgi:hypothetical protein